MSSDYPPPHPSIAKRGSSPHEHVDYVLHWPALVEIGNLLADLVVEVRGIAEQLRGIDARLAQLRGIDLRYTGPKAREP